MPLFQEVLRVEENAIDDLPPIVKGMTMREIVVLGSLATILNKI